MDYSVINGNVVTGNKLFPRGLLQDKMQQCVCTKSKVRSLNPWTGFITLVHTGGKLVWLLMHSKNKRDKQPASIHITHIPRGH